MLILIEYKYYLILVSILLVGIIAYTFDIISQSEYLNFSSEIKTQFLKMYDISEDYENGGKNKSIKDVFLLPNGNIRGLKNNELFNLKHSTSGENIQLITGYDIENQNYFLGLNQDNINLIDLDGNGNTGEINDQIIIPSENQFQIYLIDKEKYGNLPIKKEINQINLEFDSTINRGWGIDYMLIVFSNEEKAKEIFEKYFETSSQVLINDSFGISGKYGIITPIFNGKTTNIENFSNITSTPNEFCTFGFSTLPCHYE